MEANSSTGSKFYELIPTQQDNIAERSQTWTPSYSVINVDENSFSVTIFDGESGKELGGSSTYTNVKEDKNAQDDTTNDEIKEETKAEATDDYNEATKTIEITVAPKKAALNKVTSKKAEQAKVTWKKDTKATGYQIV